MGTGDICHFEESRTTPSGAIGTGYNTFTKQRVEKISGNFQSDELAVMKPDMVDEHQTLDLDDLVPIKDGFII